MGVPVGHSIAFFVSGALVVRITVKGMLIFCSLLAGLVAAEVMAASKPSENLSGASAPDVLWMASTQAHGVSLAA